MVEFLVTVNLGKHLTSSFAHEDDKFVRLQHKQCWQSAIKTLHHRIFVVKESEFDVNSDWSDAIDHLEYLDKLDQFFLDAKNSVDIKELSVNLEKIYNERDKELKAQFCVNGYDLKESTANSFVEYFIHDFFMIMNIASPGSFDLYGATIADDTKGRIYKIGMSNSTFEVALLDRSKRPWLPVGSLSLDDIAKWYLRIRTPLTMIPQSKMDRALIALMKIAKLELSEMTIILIFYAMESLFDTKTGENFNSLFNRIRILLSIEKEDINSLKKGLRQLYDLRSSIVHGGFAIIHPVHNEYFDEKMENSQELLMQAVDFGCHILVSSLQEIARRGLTELKFMERMVE